MRLTLTVTRYKGAPPSNHSSFSFSTDGGTIGRSGASDLVLDDPEKYVSSEHAKIYFNAPDFYIKDTSANGVYLNSSLLGNDNSAPLQRNDNMDIGEYTLSVSLEAELESQHFPDDITASGSLGSGFPDPDFFPLGQPENSSESISTEAGDIDSFPEFDKPGQDPISEIITGDDSSNDWPPNFDPFPDSPESTDHSGSKDNSRSPLEDPFPPRRQQPVPKPPATPARTTRTAPETETRIRPVDTAESIHNFLKGVELDPADLNNPIDSDAFYIVGKILRCSIEGTMKLLASRSEIKNEMRLDVTTVKSNRNNPIKFSVNADEALKRLLTPKSSGYMQPMAAIEEIFDDLQAHQMAVMSGMQTALKSILKKFDPELLEKRLEKRSRLSASIPIHKQAKLWSLFEELYEEIESEAEDDFNRLFGHEFSNAYEKQIKMIRRR